MQSKEGLNGITNGSSYSMTLPDSTRRIYALFNSEIKRDTRITLFIAWKKPKSPDPLWIEAFCGWRAGNFT
jgi:hypothetical protein